MLPENAGARQERNAEAVKQSLLRPEEARERRPELLSKDVTQALSARPSFETPAARAPQDEG
jgi:hypothetical protein